MRERERERERDREKETESERGFLCVCTMRIFNTSRTTSSKYYKKIEKNEIIYLN